MKRDDAWLRSEEKRLLSWPREKLIGWLQWNDGNGVWSDEDMRANDMDPMSLEDAVEQVMMFVREDMRTPEEMMSGSLNANPDRYPEPAEFDPWLKGGPMPAPQPKSRLGFKALAAKDPEAAEALYDALGDDVDQVVFEDGPGGYLVRHPGSGEMWEYDGAEGFWLEV